MTQADYRGSSHRRSLRLLHALPLLLSLVIPMAATRGASAAAVPAVTRIGVRAAPATVHVGSVVLVSGSVSPRVARVPVVLQRLVGSRWVSLRSTPVSATGTFTFSQRATAPTAIWQLRVARVGSKGVAAGSSTRLPVRVTTAIFTVRATLAASSVTAGSPVVVTGSVTPRAAGAVFLQRLQGRVWRNVTTARLTSASTYRLSTVLPAGNHGLRVVRPFTATVAGGTSPTLAVTVQPAVVVTPPPASTVTTAALPKGTVGRRYTATLKATGGSAPYTWTTAAGTLPGGMALSTDGRLWGYPIAAGTTTVRVTARNAAGGTGSSNLAITIAPAPAGTVRAWGDNQVGQLGDETSVASTPVPVAVSKLTGVTAVAGGDRVGYAVQSNGTLWAWGDNSHGQLGDGRETVILTRAPVMNSLAGVTAVAAGTTGAVLVLLSDGTVRAWGPNSEGQLGNGTTDPSNIPVQVSKLTAVVAIAAGRVNGYALRADGTVWAWGENVFGQLGNGSPAQRSTVPVQITRLSGITAIASGDTTAYALRADGTVWSWGLGAQGQLGTGINRSSPTPVQVGGFTNVTAIAASYFNGYAVHADGTVSAWGDNRAGQLGNGTKKQQLAIAQDVGLTGVTAIAAGAYQCYVITSGGSVYAWGANSRGQLGSGSYYPWLVPVRVSALTAVAIASGSRTGYAVVAG